VKQATLIIGDVEGGQVCDYPGCLVVVGDVDKGATLRADGDILVWGRWATHVPAHTLRSSTSD
jgi:septum formation inhibitor MinC